MKIVLENGIIVPYDILSMYLTPTIVYKLISLVCVKAKENVQQNGRLRFYYTSITGKLAVSFIIRKLYS